MTKKEFSKRCWDELQAKHPEVNKKLRVWRISAIIFVVLSLLTFMMVGTFFVGLLPVLIYAGIGFWATNDPAYKDYGTKLRNYVKSGEYEKYPVDYPQSFLYPGEPYPFQTTYSTTTIFNTGVQNQTPMMIQPQTGFTQTRPVQPQTGFAQPQPVQPQTGFAQPQPVQPQAGFAQTPPAQPQTGYMQTSRPVQPQTAQVQGTWQAKPVVAQMASTTEQIVCISCKQQLTIPSGRESIMVTCPSCKNSFLYTPGK